MANKETSSKHGMKGSICRMQGNDLDTPTIIIRLDTEFFLSGNRDAKYCTDCRTSCTFPVTIFD